MIEQEIKYKIAFAIASRQNTKDGINDATEIIYKLFKEQLILSGVIGMFSADKLQEAYEDGEHYGKGGDALIFDIENYR
jgi:hypothetical protein